MTQRIKYHFLQGLFHLFSVLANTTGGWKLFVQPKLIIGSLIIGTTLNSCQTKKEEKREVEQDSIPIKEAQSKCYTNVATVNKTDKAPTLNSKKRIKKIINKKKNSGITIAEIYPSFPGGTNALSDYLCSQINYPASAREAGVEGNVIVSFLVDKHGDATDVKILKSVDPACDEEAIRVVKKMPRWIPGKQGNKNVAVRMVLPIIFKLDEENQEKKTQRNIISCYVPSLPLQPKKIRLTEIQFISYDLNNEVLLKIGRINIYGHFECDLTFDEGGFLSDYFIIQSLDDRIDQQIISAIKTLSFRNQFINKTKTVRLSFDPPSSFEWKFIF